MVCKFFPFICLLTITIVFHNCFIVLLNVRRYSHIIDFTINYLNNFSDLMVSLYFEIKETKGRKFQWTVQGPIGGENGSKILVAYFLTNVHDMHWRKKEGKYRCQGTGGSSPNVAPSQQSSHCPWLIYFRLPLSFYSPPKEESKSKITQY